MTTERHQLAEEKLRAALPEAVEEVVDFRGERTIFIDVERVEDVCRLLRDDEALQFNVLEDIVADDFFPDYPRFSVSYHLYSIPNRHRVRVRTWVEDPEDGPQTVAGIWPIASWLELEVYDLMGVRFKDNTSLRRLFLPEDWQGHPLRKDYPLGYEEVQFSFNYKEVDSRKPYAKD